MRSGLTLDTGALIGLERRRDRVLRLLRAAQIQERRVTVPAAVVAEWWRGRTGAREAILGAVVVEPLAVGLSRIAGEAMARVRGATVIDAIVMASAAQRGDIVLTSDPMDLERLRHHFPAVRVLTV